MDSRAIWTQNGSMTNKTIFNKQYQSMIKTLIEIRKQQGISQRELADRLKRAHSYIGRIETFERRLDVVDLINICRALGLTNREILKQFEKLL